MKIDKNILVIIPALNADRTLGKLLTEILKFVPPEFVLIVDDGSKDQTSMIASEYGVGVISNQHRMGKGYSLRKGFEYAVKNNYEGVITLDADLQHPPELIPLFLEKARNADVVLGNRMGSFEGMPLDRKLSNTITSFIISSLIHIHIPDSQCGYRLIKTSFLSKISLRSKRYDLESEMIIKLARAGARFDFRKGNGWHLA